MLKKTLFLLIIAPFVVTCTPEALAASGVPSVMTEQNAQGFLISLNAEGVSFESLLRDLTEQCRISITGTGDAPLLQPVRIRFKDLPLEQAIGRLFKAAGIHNYLIRYSEGESCRPRITGINILSSPGQPEATGNHADRLVNLEQQKPGAHTNVPLSERDQFLEKITSFRNRYAWESQEMLNRAVYLLEAMPEEVKSPGLDTIMKELDRACGPGKGAEVGEEIFYRAIEAAADTTALVHGALERGDHVLAEGAQGTLLDIDHGTYPYVTSSSTITGGVLTSLGVGPKHVKRVVGVAKAFCSRVGAGPFPTELLDEMGARLRGTGANPWDEYGSTTGRPRRTGWFDLVALKYSARVNGLTEIVLTKLDILTGMHPLKVCIAYSYRDGPISNFPGDLSVLEQCTPIYSELPGWDQNISMARRIEDLPLAARVYILQIETFTGVRVSHVSVGPERSQIFEGS